MLQWGEYPSRSSLYLNSWWLRQQRICVQCSIPVFEPWVGKILWKRKWRSTLVFLPRKFHGQRSLAGYSPWGCKESNMTEQRTLLKFLNKLRTTETSNAKESVRQDWKGKWGPVIRSLIWHVKSLHFVYKKCETIEASWYRKIFGLEIFVSVWVKTLEGSKTW